MKNKSFEIIAIIVLAGVITLAYARFVPTFNIAGYEVRFMPIAELLNFSVKKDNNKADSLLAGYLADSLSNINNLAIDSLIALRDTNLVNPIDSAGRYALDNFFAALANDTNSVVHVAHYGASESEGDRITGSLRRKFQDYFGGSGQGYMPMREEIWNVSIGHNSTPNWQIYTVFHNRINHRFYGASGTVYRFGKYAAVKIKKDSTDNPTEKFTFDQQRDSVTATTSDSLPTAKTLPSADSTANDSVKYVYYPQALINLKLRNWYNSISIMYGNSFDTCHVWATSDKGDTIMSDVLMPSQGFARHRLNLGGSPLNVNLIFDAQYSPDFYGLLAESGKGVMVDNYAIRGHSGDGLLLINDNFLSQQLKMLNTKFIILQYGANAVPYIKSEAERKYIEDLYYDLIMKFKRAAPQASIILLGVGDMATRIEGKFVSYPSIPQMIDAQKKAAARAGIAFWNWYNVMGGENSIFTWSDKGMASKDGHFGEKGQEVLASRLFAALLTEYNIYRSRTQKHAQR